MFIIILNRFDSKKERPAPHFEVLRSIVAWSVMGVFSPFLVLRRLAERSVGEQLGFMILSLYQFKQHCHINLWQYWCPTSKASNFSGRPRISAGFGGTWHIASACHIVNSMFEQDASPAQTPRMRLLHKLEEKKVINCFKQKASEVRGYQILCKTFNGGQGTGRSFDLLWLFRTYNPWSKLFWSSSQQW